MSFKCINRNKIQIDRESEYEAAKVVRFNCYE